MFFPAFLSVIAFQDMTPNCKPVERFLFMEVTSTITCMLNMVFTVHFYINVSDTNTLKILKCMYRAEQCLKTCNLGQTSAVVVLYGQ